MPAFIVPPLVIKACHIRTYHKIESLYGIEWEWNLDISIRWFIEKHRYHIVSGSGICHVRRGGTKSMSRHTCHVFTDNLTDTDIACGEKITSSVSKK